MRCKSNDNIHCIIYILYLSPDILLVPRINKYFAGQTPLHLAVLTGKVRACEEMLNVAERSGVKLRMLMNARATGKIFNNSAMMGQIPLFVGVLTFKEKIVDLLLQRGASLFVRNSKGDNVFHTIVKYTVINRDRMADARRMIIFLHRKILEENKKYTRKKHKHDRSKRLRAGVKDSPSHEENDEDDSNHIDYRHIWYMKNNNHLTPLQLSAKFGLVEIFLQILNLSNVYCFECNKDGLFDEKKYDITEIDSITTYKSQLLSKKHKLIPFNFKDVKTESIFHMMFGSNMRSEDIVQITEIPPIRGLIKLKWHMYRKMYFAWMTIHLVFMIMVSAYAVNLSEVMFRPASADGETNTVNTSQAGSTSNTATSQETYVAVFRWVSFIYGLLYCVISVTAILPMFLQPNGLRYWKCNIDYITILLVCGLGLIVDILWEFVDYKHNRVPLLLSILTGWWFNLFFLRGLRMFSFFTVMIKRVIFGDFLRFSMIIAFQLISFSTSIHMMFQGKNIPSIDSTTDDPSYTKTFYASVFTMFNLMLGLGGLDSIKHSRLVWMTNSLYIVYVFTTYILLVNALIAMMSSTCAILLKNKHPQWRIQQLSVILFIENILHIFLNYYDPVTSNDLIEEKQKEVYDPVTKITTTQIRYLLDMNSLQNDMIEKDVADIEEVVEVNQKRNELSLSNNVNKKVLKMLVTSAFMRPLVDKNGKPVEVTSTPAPEPEPEIHEAKQRHRVPAIFYEYLKGDHDDRDDDETTIDEETLKKTVKAVFEAGKYGTVVQPFRPDSDSSDESDNY